MKQPHYALLDGLRGFSALCVMLGHLSGHAGHIGVFVDLFFVLSGFVLAPQLISGSSTSAKKFIAKRILRFWPTITSVNLFILICERTPFFVAILKFILTESQLFWLLSFYCKYSMLRASE